MWRISRRRVLIPVKVTALTRHMTGRDYWALPALPSGNITVCIDYYNQSQWRVVTQISHRGKSYLPLFLSYLASLKRSKLTKIEL